MTTTTDTRIHSLRLQRQRVEVWLRTPQPIVSTPGCSSPLLPPGPPPTAAQEAADEARHLRRQARVDYNEKFRKRIWPLVETTKEYETDGELRSEATEDDCLTYGLALAELESIRDDIIDVDA